MDRCARLPPSIGQGRDAVVSVPSHDRRRAPISLTVWWLCNILSGLRVSLLLGACALAGAVTGRVPLLPALGVLVLCIAWFAWDWERLKEYNRSERY